MTNLKSAIDTSNSNLTNMKTDVNTTMNQAKSTNDSVNVLQSQVTLNKNNIATNTSSIATNASNADNAGNSNQLGGSTLAQVLEQAKANTQLYWIDSTSNDGVDTKHTLKLATKYKEKEYIVSDYSTATQNSNAMKVTFHPDWPTAGSAGGSTGGTNWDITFPDGVSIPRTTDFTDCENEATIISRIKSFMSQYNISVASYSGVMSNSQPASGIVNK